MFVYIGIYFVKCFVSIFMNLLDGLEKFVLIILLLYYMEFVQFVVYSSYNCFSQVVFVCICIIDDIIKLMNNIDFDIYII